MRRETCLFNKLSLKYTFAHFLDYSIIYSLIFSFTTCTLKGYVSRKDFKDAMAFAKIGKSMTSEFVNRLADSYAMGSEGQYVDYLTCFRSYLNELISIMPSQVSYSFYPS